MAADSASRFACSAWNSSLRASTSPRSRSCSADLAGGDVAHRALGVAGRLQPVALAGHHVALADGLVP